MNILIDIPNEFKRIHWVTIPWVVWTNNLFYFDDYVFGCFIKRRTDILCKISHFFLLQHTHKMFCKINYNDF